MRHLSRRIPILLRTSIMQDYPLTVDRFLTHAAKWSGTREVVSARADGSVVRTNYAEVHGRANRLSGALAGLSVGEGSAAVDRALTKMPCGKSPTRMAAVK